jgi:hypothetical protein
MAVSEWTMASSSILASDALLGLLWPLWQLLIGMLLVVVVLVAVLRVAMRGPSRMGAAMLLIAGAVFFLAVLGYLFGQL